MKTLLMLAALGAFTGLVIVAVACAALVDGIQHRRAHGWACHCREAHGGQ